VLIRGAQESDVGKSCVIKIILYRNLNLKAKIHVCRLHLLLVEVMVLISRRRNEADFPGSEIILKQLKEKPSRKRVGIISKGAPGRVLDLDLLSQF